MTDTTDNKTRCTVCDIDILKKNFNQHSRTVSHRKKETQEKEHVQNEKPDNNDRSPNAIKAISLRARFDAIDLALNKLNEKVDYLIALEFESDADDIHEHENENEIDAKSVTN